MTFASELLPLLASITLLLIAARSIGRVFVWLRQPRVIGEIVGGLLLGPTLLGWWSPAAMQWLLPKAGIAHAAFPILSQAGLVLLMYASGTQLKSFITPGDKKLVASLSLAGTLLPLVAGVAYPHLFETNDLIGPAQNATAF